jgi:hypothetical protein
MKSTFKLTLGAVLLSSLCASQAFAGHWQAQQRMADSNAAYFQKQGNQTASNWSPTPPVYDTATTPHQRMAKRNAEYFSGKDTSRAELPSKQVTQPTHPTKH